MKANYLQRSSHLSLIVVSAYTLGIRGIKPQLFIGPFIRRVSNCFVIFGNQALIELGGPNAKTMSQPARSEIVYGTKKKHKFNKSEL